MQSIATKILYSYNIPGFVFIIFFRYIVDYYLLMLIPIDKGGK